MGSLEVFLRSFAFGSLETAVRWEVEASRDEMAVDVDMGVVGAGVNAALDEMVVEPTTPALVLDA